MNPRLAIILSAFLFSTGGAAIKSNDLTAWQITSARSAVAAVTVFTLLPAARRLGDPRAWAAGLAYAATLMLFVSANKLTTAASAIWLQATAPIYLLVLAPRLLDERIRPADWLLGGVMVVAVGLLITDAFLTGGTPLAPNQFLGNCLAAASGLTFAVAVLAIRHQARGGSGSLPVVVAGNVIACLASAPMALAAAGSGTASLGDAAMIVYLGAVQVGLAYWLLDGGMRRIPAFEASLCLLVEPAMSPIWTWLATGERPGALAIIGGAAIMVATAVHASRSWRRLVTDSEASTVAPIDGS